MTTTLHRSTTTQTGRALALTAICLGYLMVIMDATAVNLSLPALGHDLGGGMEVLQWVVDGYTLTFAAFLLSAGALGQRASGVAAACWPRRAPSASGPSSRRRPPPDTTDSPRYPCGPQYRPIS